MLLGSILECQGESMVVGLKRPLWGKKKVSRGLNSNKFLNDVSLSFLSINSYSSLRNLELFAVLFLKGNVVKIAAVSPSWQAKAVVAKPLCTHKQTYKSGYAMKRNGHSVNT